MLIFPPKKPKMGEVFRGPNIKPLPEFPPIDEHLSAEVLLKLGDNVSTDDILPGGSEIMALRSNIPKIGEYAFRNIYPTFRRRALESRRGFIIGGENYGQGSSREHAALVPRYLGIEAVIAESFARIHLANLVNFGILPLTFLKKQDYADIAQGDHLVIKLEGLHKDQLSLKNETRNLEIQVEVCLNSSQKEILKAGGKLAAVKAKHPKDNVQ
jgi:aconitate hydratase